VQPSKILVVEDFEEFRRLVCSLLGPREEFQVEAVADGLEAVQKAEQLQPDLILLDISLPNLNGIEVARRVHKLASGAKILFLSIESDADLVREALTLGAGYIHKPRVQRDLLPAMDAVLGCKQFVSKGLEFGEDENTEAQHRQPKGQDAVPALDSIFAQHSAACR
jgi:DNA-binding response OmpR family regulator